MFYLFSPYATNIQVSTDCCSLICLSWSYNSQVTPVFFQTETRGKKFLPFVFNMVFPTSPFEDIFLWLVLLSKGVRGRAWLGNLPCRMNDWHGGTQQPDSNTLHYTLHTHNSTLNTQHYTLITQYSSLNTQHSTLHTQHSTLNTTHSTLNTQHSTLHTQH